LQSFHYGVFRFIFLQYVLSGNDSLAPELNCSVTATEDQNLNES
jgi:hypothetical protein